MSITVFSGCSFSDGTGFNLGINDQNLWVNLVHTKLFANTNLVNLSQGGKSNTSIYRDTSWYMLSHKNISTVFVQWTSFIRYEFDLGAELYDSRCYVAPSAKYRDHHINGITYTKEYLKKICQPFVMLPHDHREIVNLLKYTNSLIQIAKTKNINIFFINGLCHWDYDFFREKDITNIFPNELTEYTKTLISVKTRDDTESFAIYQQMHNEYAGTGGINEKYWINLYDSFVSLQIDNGTDHRHPGIHSNQKYAELIKSRLTK